MRGRTLTGARIIIMTRVKRLLWRLLKMALTRPKRLPSAMRYGRRHPDRPAQSHGIRPGKMRIHLSSIEGIGIMRLKINRDVVRNKLVKDIVKAFEKAEADKARRRENSSGPGKIAETWSAGEGALSISPESVLEEKTAKLIKERIYEKIEKTAKCFSVFCSGNLCLGIFRQTRK